MKNKFLFFLSALIGVFVEEHTWASCPPGYYVDSGACIQCPVGTYSNVTDATECTQCREGHTTVEPGATSSVACSVCLPGWYKKSNICKECPVGYCCVENEAWACKKGTFAGDVGQACDTEFESSQSVCTRGDPQCSVQNVAVYAKGRCPGKCNVGCTTETMGSVSNDDCTIKTAKRFCVGNNCFSWPDEISQQSLGSSVIDVVTWSCPSGITS